MVKRDKAKRQDVPPAEPAPMPAADAPQYRAYKPVKMTDGLQTWVNHRFDHTQPFTEFVAVVRDFVTRSIAPLRDRITALEERSGGGDRAALDAHALAGTSSFPRSRVAGWRAAHPHRAFF